jgi:hypothetical protein
MISARRSLHRDIVCLSTSSSRPYRFSSKFCIHYPCAMYLRPSHTPWCDHPNYISYRVQITPPPFIVSIIFQSYKASFLLSWPQISSIFRQGSGFALSGQLLFCYRCFPYSIISHRCSLWWFSSFARFRLQKTTFSFWLSDFVQGCWYVLSPTRKETSYSDRRFWCSYILFIIMIGGILVLYIQGVPGGIEKTSGECSLC